MCVGPMCFRLELCYVYKFSCTDLDTNVSRIVDVREPNKTMRGLRASNGSVHIRVRICALKYAWTDFSILEWGC